MLSIFTFLFESYNAVDKIWLIRHCDKPNSETNPCCSELGYERAKNWHHYFKTQLHKKSIVKLYASNFNEKKVCVNNILYKPDSKCQKSQRMFLTAFYLREKLNNHLLFQEDINSHYCIGEKNKLIDNILKNQSVSDVIVVWEHKEIISIIRHFGISIKKWRNQIQNNYDIVFMIDLKTKQLFYDCFDFMKNITTCPDNVNNWLHNINKIENSYNALILYKNSSSNYKFNFINDLFLFFFILLIILFSLYGIIVIIHLIVLQRKRRQYTIIV
jgi:hypothetical protein